MHNVIVGTAGHVDHGKTCLIKALTGTDTDRLKEEQKRGITIELGFASLSGEEGQHIGIIDVPGHERFVKNMLAGIGGIDLVLLAVALDEGVMPLRYSKCWTYGREYWFSPRLTWWTKNGRIWWKRTRGRW